jgi:hypothetical protein
MALLPTNFAVLSGSIVDTDPHPFGKLDPHQSKEVDPKSIQSIEGSKSSGKIAYL